MGKLKIRKRCACLFLALIVINLTLFTACRKNSPKKIPPKAINGVLDLNNWDLRKDGPIDLTGEWEFYWEKHLKPEAFIKANPPEKTGLMGLPGSWNGYLVDGKSLSGDGYATYRLKVLMNDQIGFFAFKLLDMATAFAVYVNGKKTSFAGVAGTTSEATVPGFFPEVSDFLSETSQIEIIVHVSNFHHRLGGPWEVIRFGSQKDIHQIREKSLACELFLCGSILIMGFYHLGLFILRRKDRSPLYFGIFCCLIALRILVTGERYFTYLFPDIAWELLSKFEYLAFYLAVPFFAMFVHSLFPQETSKRIINGMKFLGAVFACIVLFTPVRIYSQTVQSYYVITLMSCMYGMYVLVLCSVRKREGAFIFLFGFTILFLTIINDILYNSLLLQADFQKQIELKRRKALALGSMLKNLMT